MRQSHIQPSAVPGTVYLVGAGPGDPGLITVRGRDLLRMAGAVVYDALANPALLDEAPPWAERIFAGKRAGHHTMSQDEINDTLCAKAYAHAVVVRLKGGDPFVFGRGGEEMACLRAAGIPVEVVPGVSSAIAAPAAAGVPVTQRRLSNSFAVVTGHRTGDAAQEPAWDALAQIDTVVVLMGLKNIGYVVKRLLEAGRTPDTPAMVVCAATLPGQQSVVATLGTLEEAAVGLPHDAPATLVVGAVVGVADCSYAVDLQPAALLRHAAGLQFAA
jgi:uroporphyrin-III C-methyltransferase